MNDLFAAPPPRRRTPVGTGVGIVLHLTVAVGAVSVVHSSSSIPRVMTAPSHTFIVFPKAMPFELRLPSAPMRVSRTRLAELRAPDPTVTLAEAVQPRRDESHVTIDSVTARAPVRPQSVLESRTVEPKRPPVVVGIFANTATAARAVETTREIRLAGFDPAVARAPELKVSGAKVGAFDVPAGAASPQPGIDRPAQGVTVGGFGNATSGVAAASSPSGGVVADTGFGGVQLGSRAPASPPAQVRAGGFDVHAAAPKPTPTEPSTAPRLDTPVEVISKPAPDYTEEARTLKLEGEVLLQVEFTAESHVRVLRVVRGLGHGLDEAAIRAAERIRFKPAQGGGHPIDFRTTVHIVFRLT